jgi:hypothetical protein
MMRDLSPGIGASELYDGDDDDGAIDPPSE